MTKKKASASRAKLPENRRKRGGNPHPNPPPVEHQFKQGQSGNPGGRPKLLGESYKQWLQTVNAQGITNAEAVAMAMGLQAIKGDVSAAREMRAATEGEKVSLQTWQTEIIDRLKEGAITPDEVIRELGEDGARELLIAAGKVIVPGASTADATSAAPAGDVA